jgi:hypothetical protein
VVALLDFTTELLHRFHVLSRFGSVIKVHRFPLRQLKRQRLATVFVVTMRMTCVIVIVRMSVGLGERLPTYSSQARTKQSHTKTLEHFHRLTP